MAPRPRPAAAPPARPGAALGAALTSAALAVAIPRAGLATPPSAPAAHPRAALAPPTRAPGGDRAIGAVLRGGALAPIFFVYERPGVTAGLDAVWPARRAAQLVLGADLGALAAPGLRRATAALRAGPRWWPAERRLWLRAGAGVAGYAERIGVALPGRRAVAREVGGAIIADTAVGLRLAAWEVAAAFAWNLTRSGGMDFVGTATVTAGREL